MVIGDNRFGTCRYTRCDGSDRLMDTADGSSSGGHRLAKFLFVCIVSTASSRQFLLSVVCSTKRFSERCTKLTIYILVSFTALFHFVLHIMSFTFEYRTYRCIYCFNQLLYFRWKEGITTLNILLFPGYYIHDWTLFNPIKLIVVNYRLLTCQFEIPFWNC